MGIPNIFMSTFLKYFFIAAAVGFIIWFVTTVSVPAIVVGIIGFVLIFAIQVIFQL